MSSLWLASTIGTTLQSFLYQPANTPSPSTGSLASLGSADCMRSSIGINCTQFNFTIQEFNNGRFKSNFLDFPRRHGKKRRRKQKKITHRKFPTSEDEIVLPEEFNRTNVTPVHEKAYYPFIAVLMPSIKPDYGLDLFDKINRQSYSTYSSQQKEELVEMDEDKPKYNKIQGFSKKQKHYDNEYVSWYSTQLPINVVRFEDENSSGLKNPSMVLKKKDLFADDTSGDYPNKDYLDLDHSHGKETQQQTIHSEEEVASPQKINELKKKNNSEHDLPIQRINNSNINKFNVFNRPLSSSEEHRNGRVNTKMIPRGIESKGKFRERIQTIDFNSNENRIRYRDKLSNMDKQFEVPSNSVIRGYSQNRKKNITHKFIGEDKFETFPTDYEDFSSPEISSAVNYDSFKIDPNLHSHRKSKDYVVYIPKENASIAEHDKNLLEDVKPKKLKNDATLSQTTLTGKFPHQKGGIEDNMSAEKGRKEWDRLGQLIIVVLLAALGTMGNTFAIAAVVSEKSLRKTGKIRCSK